VLDRVNTGPNSALGADCAVGMRRRLPSQGVGLFHQGIQFSLCELWRIDLICEG
jgi:hypothetical protein